MPRRRLATFHEEGRGVRSSDPRRNIGKGEIVIRLRCRGGTFRRQVIVIADWAGWAGSEVMPATLGEARPDPPNPPKSLCCNDLEWARPRPWADRAGRARNW